jgi:2-hydroxychromene-2-carboxylate isomerase
LRGAQISHTREKAAKAMRLLEFWFDFASTYSYPAAMRIDALAHARGVDVAWRPFLLGPLFAAQGWRDSPFNLYPVKGRYMWRDMERICAKLGLPFERPSVFPQHSLLGARIALVLPPDKRPHYSRALYAAEFAQGLAIADPATSSAILTAMGLSPEAVFAAAESARTKEILRLETEAAAQLGLPGAPCFVASDREIFWGADRMEDALDWEVARGR